MRILIIDNSAQFAELLASNLESAGYEASKLTDEIPEEERFLLYQNEYDLIILNKSVPHMSGWEIRKSVKAKKVKVPVLVIAPIMSIEDEVDAIESGADDYMARPISREEFLARVEALLQRPLEILPEEIHAGAVTLNESTREVFIGKKSIDLTSTEFTILEYLMRHIGKIVSREQLIEHLWGADSNSSSNVIDTHVKNLRKKLNGKEKKIIQTVRGIGYRIKEQ